MTRTTDDGHPGLDALAELSEGLLEPRAAGRVRGHLESCQACTDRLAAVGPAMALAGVSLRGLGSPDSPAEVTADLAGKLAGEPPVTPPVSRHARRPRIASVTAVRGRGGPGAERVAAGRRRGPRGVVLARAAAIAVLAVVAGATTYGLLTRSPAAAPGPSAAARSATALPSVILAASTRNYTDSTVRWWAPRLARGQGVSQLRPDQPLPAAVQPSRSPDSTAQTSAGGVDPQASRSLPSVLPSGSPSPGSPGAGGTPGGLSPGAPSSATAPQPDQQGGAAAGAAGIDRLRGAQALRNCIAEIAARPEAQPLVVEFARYRGDEAAVVILPLTSRTVEVWVVGPDCGIGGGDVRYMATVPLPSR